MNTELKPFTAKDLADSMQGKIRQVIADSLPEDAINELIDNEIKSFFQPRKANYYGHEMKESQFKELINKLVGEELTTRMKEKLAPFISTYWDSQGVAQFDVELQTIAKKVAPAFMERYFERLAGQMISQMAQLR